MKILHILNGDSTAESFNKANITGDIMVWREILSEGPVLPDINSVEFWNERENFICSEYNDTSERYMEIVIGELNKLNNINKFDEIVLWFEHDLFCQINLIFLINYIHNKEFTGNLSVVNIDDFFKPGFKGIGELRSENYITLYEKRFNLNIEDIETATEAWEVYSSSNPSLLNDISEINFGNLKYLNNALESHKQRFPFIENGLNKIQSDLLSIIIQKKQTLNEVVIAYLRSDFIYGIGDSQVINYIKSLSPEIVYIIDNFVYMTGEGQKLLRNETDLFKMKPDFEYYLAGVFIYKEIEYIYNPENNLIEKK